MAARILDGAEASQLTLAAAVHVRAPMQRLLDDAAALWALMGVEAQLQSGAFSEPPRLEDLAALAFDPRDLEGVRDCEAQDCGLKLDEAGLRRVRQVEWRSPGARARFSDLLREWMLGIVVAYRRDGTLPIYLDKKRPVSVAEEIARSVGESAYVDARSPFLEYVLGYPKAALPDTHDSFYWSTEKLSKPVTSLHHLVLHRGADASLVRYAIADKHLSDTHYFRSRLELFVAAGGRFAGGLLLRPPEPGAGRSAWVAQEPGNGQGQESHEERAGSQPGPGPAPPRSRGEAARRLRRSRRMLKKVRDFSSRACARTSA